MNYDHLIYIVGISGAGKNAVLNESRNIIASNYPVVFAHRYITRPLKHGIENYIMLSDKEFEFRQSKGFFSMNWQSYDYKYGIGKEIDAWLHKGCLVIVNGSREYLPVAIKKYPGMKVVLIEASLETAKKRIMERGRDSREELNKRLKRAMDFSLQHYPGIYKIDNNGDIQHCVQTFCNYLTQNIKNTLC